MEIIINEFKKRNLYNDFAEFQCFDDGMATYHIYGRSGDFHELNIINSDVTFFRNEKVSELLNFEDRFYMSYRMFNAFQEQIGETLMYREIV